MNMGIRNLGIAAIFFVLVLLVGKKVGPYNQSQIAVALTIFIGVLSINILTGLSGQLSLGQGALMAIGGYSCALMINNWQLSMWIAIPLSLIAAALAGYLLGVVAARLSGPYLAGTTLLLALALPTIANRFESVFGGETGLSMDFGAPVHWLSGIVGQDNFELWQLFVSLVFATVALFLTCNLFASRSARSWRALRDHEPAAELMGINISRTKTQVFAISSAFAGVAGALYGLRGLVGPSVFAISLSLSLLTGSILGGLRSILGAGIGALIVVFLPDWIGKAMHPFALADQLTNYLPALLSSLLLILTIVINPGGIASSLHALGRRLRGKSQK